MGIKGLEAFSHDPGLVANRDLYCLSTVSVLLPMVAVMTCSEQLSASILLKQVLKLLLAEFCCVLCRGKKAELQDVSIYGWI